MAIRAGASNEVAHAELTGPTGVPAQDELSVQQVHDAIDVIGELLARYTSLLAAVGYAELTPVIQHDWKAIFRVPGSSRPTSGESTSDITGDILEVWLHRHRPSDPAKVLLRLPRGLHDQLRATAESQGVSVNSLLVALLAGGIGWKLEPETK